MDLKNIVTLIMFSAVLLFLLPLGTAVGALVGWLVGLTFLGDWVLSALRSMGVSMIDLTEFGALMGFVGAFMRTKVERQK